MVAWLGFFFCSCNLSPLIAMGAIQTQGIMIPRFLLEYLFTNILIPLSFLVFFILNRRISHSMVPSKKRHSSIRRISEQIADNPFKSVSYGRRNLASRVGAVKVVTGASMPPAKQGNSSSLWISIDVANNAHVVISVARWTWSWLLVGVKVVKVCSAEPMMDGNSVCELAGVQVSGYPFEVVSRGLVVDGLGSIEMIGFQHCCTRARRIDELHVLGQV